MLTSIQDQLNLIRRTLAGESTKTNDLTRTIFHEILSSKLPASDKTHQRLADEAQIVVGGGVETTAFTLSIAAFHIINTPRIYERLHKDLVAALPIRENVDLYSLEKVEYLKACVMEAVRLSYGLSARNPRTRDVPMRYQEWIIPANTCVVRIPTHLLAPHLTVHATVNVHPRRLTRPLHLPRQRLLHPGALAQQSQGPQRRASRPLHGVVWARHAGLFGG